MEIKTLPSSFLPRLSKAMLGQRKNLFLCPEVTEFKGRVALVTGATNGIGKAIAFGLLQRGIRTILIGRSKQKLKQTKDEFLAKGILESTVLTADCNLADLTSMKGLETELQSQLKGQKISILIENAGVWPRKYETTKQGFEIAFGTNVLGHQYLRSKLIPNLLDPQARIVLTTGDIYFLEKTSSVDFKYRGPIGGLKAYCRSKLGNIWIARKLQEKHPDFTVAVVHPGVVASGLGGANVFTTFIKSLFMIDTSLGAQTSLFVATQSDIRKGGYYHNVNGLSEFPLGDPALDQITAGKYWEQVERLVLNFDSLPL